VRAKRGPQPVDRRRLNPAFRPTVYSRGPLWKLSNELGFRHVARFSHLINAKYVKGTPMSIGDLFKIADAVGFDRRLLFLDGR
jgi:hypothetical protein